MKKLLFAVACIVLISLAIFSSHSQAAYTAIGASPAPSPGTVAWEPLSCFDFTQTLSQGRKGAEVRFLQAYLIKEGFSIPSGNYGVFDKDTAAAVKGFQEKYGSEILTKLKLPVGNGVVGVATRAKLNSIYGCAGHVSVGAFSGTANMAITNIVLDPTGIGITSCNKGKNNIPTFPIRVRVNGINRDFDITGALVAGTCDTSRFSYDAWGLSYDAGTTIGAVILMDPNGYYKDKQLQYPLDGNNTLKIPAVNGIHLAARGLSLKSNGVQLTACNLGTTNLTSFPVRITLNNVVKDFDVQEVYQAGKCQTKTYDFSAWGLTYTPGTTYSATAVTDPNNIYNEVNELDNAASVVGIP